MLRVEAYGHVAAQTDMAPIRASCSSSSSDIHYDLPHLTRRRKHVLQALERPLLFPILPRVAGAAGTSWSIGYCQRVFWQTSDYNGNL
jgi:hypothetical protein